LHDEKEVVMRWGRHGVQDESEVGMGEREFTLNWNSETSLASFDHTSNEEVTPIFTDFWKKQVRAAGKCTNLQILG
jgi:hypothetical protein